MTDEYLAYIQSSEWQVKRLTRLLMDGNECQICMSKKNLHVHHKTYRRLGSEDILSDLITLCEDCHNAITHSIRARRQQAYENRRQYGYAKRA